MRKIKLFTTTHKIIYEGIHSSIKDAIESAIQNNVVLDDIDLSFMHIHHINLDGVTIHRGLFRETNLCGANMSESKFINCDFSGAILTDACLCYSDIKGCNFKYAKFAATDISMSHLSFCEFQGWNTFNLDFHTAYKLDNLTFSHDKKIYNFDTPPRIHKTALQQKAILENAVIVRNNAHTLGHNMIIKSVTSPQNSCTIIDRILQNSVKNIKKN